MTYSSIRKRNEYGGCLLLTFKFTTHPVMYGINFSKLSIHCHVTSKQMIRLELIVYLSRMINIYATSKLVPFLNVHKSDITKCLPARDVLSANDNCCFILKDNIKDF